VLFLGLTGVYVSEFFASLQLGVRRVGPGRSVAGTAPAGGLAEDAGAAGGAQAPSGNNPAERMLGFFHIITGIWLMYLVYATTLNISLKYNLPGG
jgi:hypothetical protein